jgi:hypothetical protein
VTIKSDKEDITGDLTASQRYAGFIFTGGKTMKIYRCFFYLSGLIFLAGVITGCCKSPETNTCRADRVVAKINNYELTVDDFRDEARLIAPNLRLSADADNAKDGILNELITKKVLLQEAQRQNFDKDRQFMKEIERYWEQALLKFLMKKKIDEFSKKIDPNIIYDNRQKLMQSELDKWVTDVRSSAKVTVYKKNLKNIEIK